MGVEFVHQDAEEERRRGSECRGEGLKRMKPIGECDDR
jgi:hypothetical protein